MTPEHLAALFASAFVESRAWDANEIADLIAGPGGFLVTRPSGFAIGRAVAGEAELVTVVVSPTSQRNGTGRALLAAFEDEARIRGATAAFLEVAADNIAALGLYRGAGWQETGRRAGYYTRTTGNVDALTMSKSLAAEIDDR
jgi:ribosomal-protein-alanine N-acetyltransferase